LFFRVLVEQSAHGWSHAGSRNADILCREAEEACRNSVAPGEVRAAASGGEVAREEFDDRPGDDIWADWPWFCRIMQQLGELVPGFEFT
jgi:hypothetical protein